MCSPNLFFRCRLARGLLISFHLGITLQRCGVKSGTCRHLPALSSRPHPVLRKGEAVRESALSLPSIIRPMEAREQAWRALRLQRGLLPPPPPPPLPPWPACPRLR